MNRYTLNADGNRWWWGSALAGATSTAAILVVTALPVAGQAMPVSTTRHEPATSYVVVDSTQDPDSGYSTEGLCFLHRASWNEALDWPQPTCRQAAREDSVPAAPRVIRVGLDWRP
ncbi:hypothetical protein J2X46_002842 [Nocardioides sp. BE266]|uniref:hypothetical protein n=1 Tax=Nocardioides sp. BE266 TaxID=2817725 RepID=UPI00285C5EBD|nr:hypothetical protein [Nocardioides sp. BE266]MDR7253852.1 hypothetical protein [Nocardioides sp. BE266]